MNVLIFIAVLVILVIVHEFGHFIVAKLFKIRVEEFGVGYPPRAFTFGKWGETEYTLNWIPFGGFVRIFGEDPSAHIDGPEKKRSFLYKPWYVKAAVLIAGVVFNMGFAVILFALSASSGAPVTIDESSALASKAKVVITQVYEGSPANVAEIMAGDIVMRMSAENNKTKTPDTLATITPATFSEFIASHGGKKVSIDVTRGIEEKTIELTPAHGVLEGDAGKPAIGVQLGFILKESVPIYQTIGIGFRESKDWFVDIVGNVVHLVTGAFTGTANIKEISGPVGIAVHVGEWSALGFAYLLYFTAIISVNLAVINLIPIPALDGGRLLFVLIEAVIRRDIPLKFAQALNAVGFGALILLMLLVTYNDIFKLVKG
ncbi:MAG: site-2 protease family protein [Minisyncoccia bacterium]